MLLHSSICVYLEASLSPPAITSLWTPRSTKFSIFHPKHTSLLPKSPIWLPPLFAQSSNAAFSLRGKRSLAKIPDLQQVVRLFSEHKYNETLRLASVARGGRRVRTLHHNWSLKTLLNHLRSSLLCLFCNNGFTRREKLLSRRPVSVTAEWQLNNSLVSPLVHPDASRPEYQSSLGSGLHRKRRRGDHPGRRNRERPPRPHQQLCESTILRRIRQPPRQWQTNEEQSLELEGRPDLCICFAGPRGQLWRQRRRCRPPAKIHAAEREQVKKKEAIWQRRDFMEINKKKLRFSFLPKISLIHHLFVSGLPQMWADRRWHWWESIGSVKRLVQCFLAAKFTFINQLYKVWKHWRSHSAESWKTCFCFSTQADVAAAAAFQGPVHAAALQPLIWHFFCC